MQGGWPGMQPMQGGWPGMQPTQGGWPGMSPGMPGMPGMAPGMQHGTRVGGRVWGGGETEGACDAASLTRRDGYSK